MTKREQIKKEIDEISDDYLETLHRIIVALKSEAKIGPVTTASFKENPLKDSLVFEKDIITPIDEAWDSEQ